MNSGCSSGIDVRVNISSNLNYNLFNYNHIPLFLQANMQVSESESEACTAGITTQPNPSALYRKSIRAENYKTPGHNAI